MTFQNFWKNFNLCVSIPHRIPSHVFENSSANTRGSFFMVAGLSDSWRDKKTV